MTQGAGGNCPTKVRQSSGESGAQQEEKQFDRESKNGTYVLISVKCRANQPSAPPQTKQSTNAHAVNPLYGMVLPLSTFHAFVHGANIIQTIILHYITLFFPSPRSL